MSPLTTLSLALAFLASVFSAPENCRLHSTGASAWQLFGRLVVLVLQTFLKKQIDHSSHLWVNILRDTVMRSQSLCGLQQDTAPRSRLMYLTNLAAGVYKPRKCRQSSGPGNSPAVGKVSLQRSTLQRHLITVPILPSQLPGRFRPSGKRSGSLGPRWFVYAAAARQLIHRPLPLPRHGITGATRKGPHTVPGSSAPNSPAGAIAGNLRWKGGAVPSASKKPHMRHVWQIGRPNPYQCPMAGPTHTIDPT